MSVYDKHQDAMSEVAPDHDAPPRSRSRKTASSNEIDLPPASRKCSPNRTSLSPAMQETLDLAKRVAQTDTTVLITGESGTGKERIARLIHDHSPRADGPFIAINCGAIAETLLDSELFGHVRGAFTGAVQTRPGIFEAANHGTLLLDEIGEISLGMQVKLLRVLQEREVRRVGDSESRRFDTRILAATNRDLARQIEGGSFREDLYYRIRIVELQLPPLRERAEDILDLARELLAESAERLKRQVSGFSPPVEARLLGYHWPGNIRELENAMEHAVALSRSKQVELIDLPRDIRDSASHFQPRLQSVRPLQDISKDYILAALNLNEGNQTSTAKQLGIGSATLYRKLKRYGCHPIKQGDEV